MLKVNIHWFTVFLFAYHNNSTRKTPVSWSLKESITVKILNIWTPYKFAVVTLRFEQLKRYEPPHDKTNKMTVCPGKTQISLGMRPVWSESSLCAHWVAKDPSFLYADSKDSDQTGQVPRLIWVFPGRTCHFVWFVVRWLVCRRNSKQWRPGFRSSLIWV